ncbi:hypothetical protein [Luteimonas sp. R10]|uniref:hypothetical protein n=1 Tax=Luteimonas sp. R10 TaxID=3108176 RepID=UPI00308850AB|nr:hypothetical protein U3649_11780 [Luteimonas sp. R10]
MSRNLPASILARLKQSADAERQDARKDARRAADPPDVLDASSRGVALNSRMGGGQIAVPWATEGRTFPQ